jgi:hypothetical protein
VINAYFFGESVLKNELNAYYGGSFQANNSFIGIKNKAVGKRLPGTQNHTWCSGV